MLTINNSTRSVQNQDEAGINISVFTSTDDLTKTISLEDGKLVKKTAGQMVSGSYEKKHIDDLYELEEVLSGLEPNQAASYGVADVDTAPVRTKDKVSGTKGAIARSREHFSFAEVPAVFMIDYDPPEGGVPLTPDQLYAAILEVMPELDVVEMLWRPSASSCIYHGDEELVGVAGQRLYFRVNNGSAIPNVGETLTKRLWLAGHGYIFISKAGSMHPRTIADDSVWQPERLDFAAGAKCNPPLERKPGESLLYGEGGMFKTETLKPLTAAEESRYKQLVQAAKNKAQPEADEVRSARIEAKVDEIVDADASEAEREKVRKVEGTAFGLGVNKPILHFDFELHLNQHTTVTVRQVQADKDRYRDVTICNPVEPEYRGYALNSKFRFNDGGSAHIFSWAHGGQEFLLQTEEADELFGDGASQSYTPRATFVGAASPLSWTQNFTLSDEEMNKISNPEWIITNMVIQGHLIVIVAEPNGGKTTILMHLSGEMAAAGYQVFYVNADTSGGDAKPMHAYAREKDFTLMLPDMASGGLSMADVVDHLAGMNAVPGADYSKVVFVFDTLKKMTSVISKAKSGKLYKLLRSLSSKGMTIILLAHTNKYKADDGTPIYEGTGDLRADVDELIYLIPEKQEDKSMIVTTSPDKVRGAFEPVTYEIDADRNVKLLEEVVDTAKHREMLTKLSRDRTTIDAIDMVIDAGHTSQKALVDACNTDHGIKEHTARRVLKAYSMLILPDMVNVIRRPNAGQLWGMRRTGVNNRIEYSKLPQKSAESLWEE